MESACDVIDIGTLCRLCAMDVKSNGTVCLFCDREFKSRLALVVVCVNAVRSIVPPSTPEPRLEFCVSDDTRASTAAEDGEETEIESASEDDCI